MTTATSKIETMTLAETLEAQKETHQTMCDWVTDGEADTPKFRYAAECLNRLNIRLVVLGYRG
jgi:hypothetical protein